MEITVAQKKSWVKKMKESIVEQVLSLNMNKAIIEEYHMPKAADKSQSDHFATLVKNNIAQTEELEHMYGMVLDFEKKIEK